MNALVVLILVASGETSHPTTLGAVGAAREVLGPDHEIAVREMPNVPNDERALSVGSSLRAAAIVELSWDLPAHRQARIRFHLDRRPGFNDRLIVFDETDDVGERGRTIGYAIASMMTGPTESDRRPVPRPPSPMATPRPPDATPRPRTRGAIDVTAAGAMGLDGHAGGWGGTLSGRWYVAAPLALRVGASARAGTVTPAQSTSLLLHAAAGLAWAPFPSGRGSPVEVGFRLDALLLREQMTHFSSDDPEPVTAMRWLPGADAGAEVSWLFSANAGFLGAFGAEFAFGRTDVTLHQEKVTSIPPVRLVIQMGIRVTF
jgi:hypothetical protein